MESSRQVETIPEYILKSQLPMNLLHELTIALVFAQFWPPDKDTGVDAGVEPELSAVFLFLTWNLMNILKSQSSVW